MKRGLSKALCRNLWDFSLVPKDHCDSVGTGLSCDSIWRSRSFVWALVEFEPRSTIVCCAASKIAIHLYMYALRVVLAVSFLSKARRRRWSPSASMTSTLWLEELMRWSMTSRVTARLGVAGAGKVTFGTLGSSAACANARQFSWILSISCWFLSLIIHQFDVGVLAPSAFCESDAWGLYKVFSCFPGCAWFFILPASIEGELEMNL